MAADLAALKDWVTAADSEQFSRLPDGVVSVNISHSNITARMIELKFDLSQTVRQTGGGKGTAGVLGLFCLFGSATAVHQVEPRSIYLESLFHFGLIGCDPLATPQTWAASRGHHGTWLVGVVLRTSRERA